jgi:phosphoserine phosphatase
VIFDLEGTLVNAELFPEIGKRLGDGDLLEKMTNLAMNGVLEFKEAFFRRLKLIQGTPLDLVKEVCFQLPLFSGAQETVNYLKGINCQLAISTGSFGLLAKRVAAELGIEHVLSNKFIIKGGKIVSVKNPVVTPEVKATYLKNLARRYDTKLERCIVIGDGANDIPMMKAAGLSVAFNPKKIVEEIADVVVRGANLKEIFPHIRNFYEKQNGGGI